MPPDDKTSVAQHRQPSEPGPGSPEARPTSGDERNSPAGYRPPGAAEAPDNQPPKPETSTPDGVARYDPKTSTPLDSYPKPADDYGPQSAEGPGGESGVPAPGLESGSDEQRSRDRGYVKGRTTRPLRENPQHDPDSAALDEQRVERSYSWVNPRDYGDNGLAIETGARLHSELAELRGGK